VHCQPVAQCSGCGAGLAITQSECVETRQEIDIPPIKAYVTEYQRMAITCQCGQRQLAQRLKSFLVYLNITHVLPYARLTQLMNDLFDIQICKRSIENALEETATKAMSVYHQIMTLIKQCKWVGSDETGCRVEGKRWWQWTWQSDLGSYYAIDQRRGYNVVKTHFGEDYQGTLCHDCWSAHNNTVAKSGHQQCHPHIQRDLIFLVKTYKCRWAYALNAFLLASQKARDRIFSEGV
jgi:transposase